MQSSGETTSLECMGIFHRVRDNKQSSMSSNSELAAAWRRPEVSSPIKQGNELKCSVDMLKSLNRDGNLGH